MPAVEKLLNIIDSPFVDMNYFPKLDQLPGSAQDGITLYLPSATKRL